MGGVGGSRRWATGIAVLAMGMVAPSGSSAAPDATADGALPVPADRARITVTDITGPEGEPWETALQINERGQVVGTVGSGTQLHAVLWQRGRATRLAPGDAAGSVPLDISDRGQVVGARLWRVPGLYPLAFSPFSWSDGEWTDLTAEGDRGWAVDVNDRGQVLGYAGPLSPPSGPTVVWDDDGRRTEAPGPHTLEPPPLGDINDHGQAVVNTGASYDKRAALWQVGSGLTELATLDRSTWGLALNDAGDVAGTTYATPGQASRAYLWRNGEITDLGTLGGGNAGLRPSGPNGPVFPFAPASGSPLNERGRVVGHSETATGENHAFLWRNGHMTDLGTLGGAHSYALAVNDRDEVVGYSETATGGYHAFLWRNGHMTDLGALAGQANSVATDINDRGQITGMVGDSSAFGSADRCVLWTIPRQ